jgi:hypothetical protein
MGNTQIHMAYLDVVSLVVVTTFTEEPMVHNTVDVELIQQRIAVLCWLALIIPQRVGYTPLIRMQ